MKEKIIFELYKDTPFMNAEDFRKEIKKYNVAEPNRLYTKIINYQIKKYGNSLQLYSTVRDYKAVKNIKKKWR